MFKKIGIVVFFIAVQSAWAGEFEIENAYIPFGALYYDMDEYRSVDDDVLPQLGFGYRINEAWATEVMLAKGQSDAHNVFGADAVELRQLRVDALHFYDDWKGVTPYSVMGVADASYDPEAATLSNDHDTLLSVGLGVLKKLDDNWAARAELRDFYSLEDDQNEYGLNFIVQYQFGARAMKSTPKKQFVAAGESVELELVVHFATNRAEVQQQYFSEIKRIAKIMKKYKKITVTVEGHTDDRGAASYNKGLSQRRADAIRSVLINKYGIDADRVMAKGYGEEKAIVSNQTAEGRQQNRRVVAVFENTPK